MSHIEQISFFNEVKKKFPQFFNGVSVLEIGSLDINGSVRQLYNARIYLGVDLERGKGVDIVGEGQKLNFPDNSFDVSISAECFEHNPYWLETFLNMCRIASQFITFSCASEGRREHGTSRTTPKDSPFTSKWDYYRNLSKEDFTSRIDFDQIFSEYEFTYSKKTHDLYFWGIKK